MMKKSKARTHTGIRIEPALLLRVEAYAQRLTEETAVPVNRAMAIRALIVKGLETVEGKKAAR